MILYGMIISRDAIQWLYIPPAVFMAFTKSAMKCHCKCLNRSRVHFYTFPCNRWNEQSSVFTFSVVELQFDGLALVDVQVGEPHGGGEQYQQQQELELLPDLLHGEAQHPC